MSEFHTSGKRKLGSYSYAWRNPFVLWSGALSAYFRVGLLLFTNLILHPVAQNEVISKVGSAISALLLIS